MNGQPFHSSEEVRSARPQNVVRLGALALTRSGDKGNHVNLGVVAYSQANFEFLVETLTEPCIEDFFSRCEPTAVKRYLLANVGSLNFLIYNALGGGASRSLRLDSQGKLFGLAAAEILLPLDPGRRAHLELRSREPPEPFLE
jgi:hypothetical protein